MDQLIEKFRTTENQYRELKARLLRGEVSTELAKAEIKKMMIQDDTGTYWMMGGKTGKWYKHVDNQWAEADPFAELMPPEPEPQEVGKDEPYELESYQVDEVVSQRQTLVEEASASDEEPLFVGSNDSYANPAGGLALDIDTTLGADAGVDGGGVEWGRTAAVDAGGDDIFGTNADHESSGTFDVHVSEESELSLGTGDLDFSAHGETRYKEEESSVTVAEGGSQGFAGFGDASDADDGFGDALDAANGFGAQQQQTMDFGGMDFTVEATSHQQVFGDLEVSLDEKGSASTVTFDNELDYASGASGNQADFGGLAESSEFKQEKVQADINRSLDSGFAVDADFESGLGGDGAMDEQSDDFEDTGGVQLNAVDTKEFALDGGVANTGGVSIDLENDYQDNRTSFAEEITQEPGAGEENLFQTQDEQPLPTAVGGLGSFDTKFSDEVADAPMAAMETDILTFCVSCQSKIPQIAVYCSLCGANQKELIAGKAARVEERELVIKSIRFMSFLFFFGGLGLIAGVIFGAAFGILKTLLPALHDQLPIMLQESRGGVAGGLIFAAIGGIGGFVTAAFGSMFISGIYNLVSFVFGGIRFRVKG